ncbi:MAG TPA: hypothetical protein VN520_26580 [Streptomyces sp.]|uniref:hypothetical protein n=1 Tax=Streptomyces sp. TaxID=1931 RepID=UPI002C4E5BE6|nr:hypothetical protein [Streptomyces sp.]HWU09896.1 hypothetical protein [Streptomyces sp.]
MSKNTTREHDRAVRAYMAQHAVPFSEARRALAATPQKEASGTVFSEWEGFTLEERRRRWDGVKLSGLASRQELRLLGEVAAELGSGQLAAAELAPGRWRPRSGRRTGVGAAAGLAPEANGDERVRGMVRGGPTVRVQRKLSA